MRDSDTAVVIPAYKESENIQILIREIRESLPDATVIIVDDSPRNENRKLRRILDKMGQKILLISRFRKLGRGNAVLCGFQHAFKNPDIRYFFEMDADLSHNPQEFEKFLPLGRTYDLIIGSRYLVHSAIKKWPLHRLVLSRLINAFLNIWLGLKLTDYTNGFRLYRRASVGFLLGQKLRESGFIALSEVAYKLRKAGFLITEVPITFTDRAFGKSSAGLREHVASLIGAVRIRLS